MARLTKKRKIAEPKVDSDKLYGLQEAMALVKEVNTAKFDASVDLHINLGVCLLYTSPSPRDRTRSRMPSSA